MKRILIIVIAITALSVSAFAGDTETRFHKQHSRNIYHSNCLNNLDIDLDDGVLTFSGRRGSEPIVEITEDSELYINGDLIKVNKEQKKLLANYYDLNMKLLEEAEEIGIQGAKIGIEGAKIGLKAVTSLFYLFDDDYDMDDYERDIEREADKLELKAEELEDRAEEIEEIADDLEELYDELEEEITELGELEWY